jgi:general stress protein YciG
MNIPVRYQANRSASSRLPANYGQHDYYDIGGLLSLVKNMAEEKKGEMTVGEAGRKGGHKGGEKVKEKYGPEFYSKIGQKGGQRVRELIKEGEEAEKKKK